MSTPAKPAAHTTQNPAKPATPANPPTPATAKPAEGKPADAKPTGKDDGLSLDFLSEVVILVPGELASEAAPQRARSEKQVKMDENVAKLHKAWKTAGQPSQWPKLVEAKVVATYFVEPNKSAELKRLVNRAVQFHGIRARWGTSFSATEKLVTQYGLPRDYIGREVVSFAVMDKRPRSTEDKKN